jgi:hydrogenase/urease accessory protein HupE
VVIALLAGASVSAHEIGTTRVAVQVQDGRYDIEVATDATALLEKLRAVADPEQAVASIPGLNPADLRGRISALDAIFRQRLRVAFDELPARPAITYSVSPAVDAASPPRAVVRLSGTIPADARHFTWRYSWTFASYALSLQSGGASQPTTEWLEGGEQSTPFAVATPAPGQGRLGTAWQYLVLGFTHILPHGLDHMLFVIGIFLFSNRLRSVLAQVTAFTVAHSVTLGLSLYGLITVSPAVVEPLIAVSIAYVAIENLVLTELRLWRIALVFSFGLLHGMGFAGALQELGLPRSEFLTALVTFNAGVEAGQLTVIAAAFALVGWHWGNREWYRRRVIALASVLIACTAVYWTVERVTS